MRQLIAGNWKMNGSCAEAVRLARAIRAGAERAACDILLCPPFPHLIPVAGALEGSALFLGGQDCAAALDGTHTGDVSAAMLRDAGVRWVILGHSERRRDHHETSAQIRAKTESAMTGGLIPLVAVGETAPQRRDGHTESVIGEQLAASLPEAFQGVVAYEPVWAIGSGQTPDDDSILKTIAFIRRHLIQRFASAAEGLRILYGGSVTHENAARLLALPGIDGALVGGASLDAEGFLGIVQSAGRVAAKG